MHLKYAIIPAAGLGTRFLPITKSIPKEMIPLVDKPALQYILQEITDSNISNTGIIISDYKKAIVDYLNPDNQVVRDLSTKGKLSLLNDIQKLCKQLSFEFIPQLQPKGLGHAISLVQDLVENDFFGILLPDDIMVGTEPALAQLMRQAERVNGTVIAVQKMDKSRISAYGVVQIESQVSERLYKVSDLVEKPQAEHAPSEYAVVGRYVVSPVIFNALNIYANKPGAGGELQLTDALAYMARSGQPVYAYELESERFDTGTPAGWLEATVKLALQNPTYKNIVQNACTSLAEQKPGAIYKSAQI